MHEIWLQPNRRAVCLGCVPPLIIVGLGGWLAFGPSDSADHWWRWTGAALMVIGIALVGVLIRQLLRPRIAYRDGQVLFYLRSGRPIAVPVQMVEAFFLGQGPATLPGGIQLHERTVNLVARLSQRATEWARRDVKPALGNWCDGYVTIRGTWCEPLTADLVRQLNRRLEEVKTQDEGNQGP